MPEILATTFELAVSNLAASTNIDKLGFTEDLNVDGWLFLRRGACQLRLRNCFRAITSSKNYS